MNCEGLKQTVFKESDWKSIRMKHPTTYYVVAGSSSYSLKFKTTSNQISYCCLHGKHRYRHSRKKLNVMLLIEYLTLEALEYWCRMETNAIVMHFSFFHNSLSLF